MLGRVYGRAGSRAGRSRIRTSLLRLGPVPRWAVPDTHFTPLASGLLTRPVARTPYRQVVPQTAAGPGLDHGVITTHATSRQVQVMHAQ